MKLSILLCNWHSQNTHVLWIESIWCCSILPKLILPNKKTVFYNSCIFYSRTILFCIENVDTILSLVKVSYREREKVCMFFTARYYRQNHKNMWAGGWDQIEINYIKMKSWKCSLNIMQKSQNVSAFYLIHRRYGMTPMKSIQYFLTLQIQFF